MGTLRDVLGVSDRRRAREAAARAGLSDFAFTGPGGMSVSFGPTAGAISLGALDPIRQMLLQAVSSNLSAGPGTDALSAAAERASSELGTGGGIDPSFINVLAALAGREIGSAGVAPTPGEGLGADTISMLRDAISRELGGGADFNGIPSLDTSGMVRDLFGAAGDRLATAAATADQVAAERLALLREQAAPYEQRMIQDRIGELFARGRLGTNDTLSGLVGEGIARALSEADLSRQLAAQELGRQTQADAVSQALGLISAGSGLAARSFDEALQRVMSQEAARTGAVGRASSLAGILSGALGDEFAQRLASFQAQEAARTGEIGRILPLLQAAGGFAEANAARADARALARFDIARQLFEAEQAGAQNAFTRALGGLQGIQGIDSLGLQQFMAALQSAVARSNAALGQASTFTQLSNITPILDFAVGMASAFGPLGRTRTS